jgi:hypothetical protein
MKFDLTVTKNRIYTGVIRLEIKSSPISLLKMETACFSNCCYLPTNPYSLTTRKTNMDIFTAIRTSNIKTIIQILSEVYIALRQIYRLRTCCNSCAMQKMLRNDFTIELQKRSSSDTEGIYYMWC